MSFECTFCGNLFVKKCSLLYHQRTAKYCLKIRGENTKYTCKICCKQLSDKRYFEKHSETCGSIENIREQQTIISKHEKTIVILQTRISQIKSDKLDSDNQYEKTIQDQARQISDLQNKLENIAIQGVRKSTTTNNTINLQPLTKEWLDAQALLLTEEHFSQGVIGLAQFAVDNSFKNRVVCTDINRKSLKYKEDDGKVSKDPRGKKLSKMFFESIETKADNIIPAMIEKIKEEMDGATTEPGSVFESVCDKMDEIIKVKKGIKHITKGQEHDLKEDFTRQLCELLPNP